MLKYYYLSSLAMLALYGMSATMGWGFGDSPRSKIPADARQAPGGYRSYHFWHSGFRGGK